MDPQDISKMDPTKLQFHPETKIKQEHIDQISYFLVLRLYYRNIMMITL